MRVTDKEGNTQNLYSYDAYGRILKEQETIPLPFGFTGYLKETCKDLYYTGSREYDPLSGTFHSKDKYRYMDTNDPLSMNLYAYAKSNPLRYLDFDGHESIAEKSYWERLTDRMALMTCTDGTLGAGLGINLWLSVFGPDLPMDTSDVAVYFAKNFSPQQLSWWLTLGGTEASYMCLLKLEEHSKQLNSTGDKAVLPQNAYSLEEIEAEVKTGINAYWNQGEYFSDGWWKDKGKKEEALNMLLIETLLTGGEAGGYDLMQHYTESEPGNPKRYALQMLFQLEPIDGDDEIVLNNIAGACIREGVDLVENGWIIPPEIMQLHAENHEELQVRADMYENRMMSFALNFTPVMGEVKSVVEFAMGEDMLTGEKLSWVERVLGVATWFVDIANFGKLGKGLKYTDEVLENADEVTSAVTKAEREGIETLTEELDELVPDMPVKEPDTVSMDDILKSDEGVSGGKNNLSDQIEGNSYDINILQKTQPYTYPDNVSSIKEAIVQNGPNSVPPIEIRVHHGQVLVVDGHHRLEAFRQLGYNRVPIRYLHDAQLGKTFSDGTYYRSIEELLDAVEISN